MFKEKRFIYQRVAPTGGNDKPLVRPKPDTSIERRSMMPEDPQFDEDVKNDMEHNFLPLIRGVRPELTPEQIMKSQLGAYVRQSLKRGYQAECPYEFQSEPWGFKLVGTVPPPLPTMEYRIEQFDENLNYKKQNSEKPPEESEEEDGLDRIERDLNLLIEKIKNEPMTPDQLREVADQVWELGRKVIDKYPELAALYNWGSGWLSRVKESLRVGRARPIDENLGAEMNRLSKDENLSPAIALLGRMSEIVGDLYDTSYKKDAGITNKEKILNAIQTPKLESIFQQYKQIEKNLADAKSKPEKEKLQVLLQAINDMKGLSRKIAEAVPALAPTYNWIRGVADVINEARRRHTKFKGRTPNTTMERMLFDALTRHDREMVEGIALLGMIIMSEMKYHEMYINITSPENKPENSKPEVPEPETNNAEFGEQAVSIWMKAIMVIYTGLEFRDLMKADIKEFLTEMENMSSAEKEGNKELTATSSISAITKLKSILGQIESLNGQGSAPLRALVMKAISEISKRYPKLSKINKIYEEWQTHRTKDGKNKLQEKLKELIASSSPSEKEVYKAYETLLEALLKD